jgi:hypothetical protein
MNIIDKYRTKNKLELNTENIKTQINKNCIALELDGNMRVYFTKGAEQYYTFIQNPKFYQTNEIKFVNIIKDPNVVIDTVDDEIYYEDGRIYSIAELNGIVFLMFYSAQDA